MEITYLVIAIGAVGMLMSFASGMAAGLISLLVYILGAAITGWVLSVMARRQLDLVVHASTRAVSAAVADSFSGVGWKSVNGPGQFNFQARGLGLGAYNAKRPVISIDVEDNADGAALVNIWTSAWSSQFGMMALCDRVITKRFRLGRKLAELSSATHTSLVGGHQLPSPARSKNTELVDQHRGGTQPPINPPDLDRIEFIYQESRRYEDQSAIRTDQPPASIWSIPQRLGVLGSSGRPILPWDARNVTGAVTSPSGRTIAFIIQGLDPLRIQTADGLDVAISSLPAFRIMQNQGFSVCGMSWSPDGRQLACLEWNGIGTLTLLDATTGTRTFLTTLQGVAGNEVPVFSADGRWILVSTHNAPQLISLEDRSVVHLPLKSAHVDWWPSKGPSALFVLTGAPGEQHYGLYDLATATLNDLGQLTLPVQDDLPKNRQIVFGPRMCPDGTRVLVGTFFGPDARYQDEQGSRQRVAILDIATGSVTMQTEPFADPGRWLERVHERWSWVNKPGTSAPTAGPTQISNELRATALPFEKVDPAKAEPADERIVVWPLTYASAPTSPISNRPTLPPINALSTPPPADSDTSLPPVGGYATLPTTPTPTRPPTTPLIEKITPRHWAILAAVMTAAIATVVMINAPSHKPSTTASNGGSRNSNTDESNASVKDVSPCTSTPTLTPRGLRFDSDGLEVTTLISSSCSDGDLLSNSRFRVTTVDSAGRDVASGIFDLSSTPIAVGRDGTMASFIFPAGTYWRTADAISGDIHLTAHAEGSDSSVATNAQSASTVRAASAGSPESGSADAAAQSALVDIAAADRAYIDSNLLNQWQPQLSSKYPGLHADGITWSAADIIREHMELRERFPDARLVWSPDWPVYRSDPQWWITLAGVPFNDSDGANGWCSSKGFDSDHCYAKMLSHTLGTNDTTRFR